MIKKLIHYSIFLGLIGAVSASLLFGVYSLTQPAIEEKQKKEQIQKFKEILGDLNIRLSKDLKSAFGYENGKLKAVAVVGEAKGYGGPIKVLVRVSPEGKIERIEVISASKETPGIGQKIKEESFLKRFCGLTKNEIDSVQTITGATISSTGVKKAVAKALDKACELVEK